MNALLRKITALENNVVDETPDYAETSISIKNEAENALHREAEQRRQNITANSQITIEYLQNSQIPLLERNETAKVELAKMPSNDLAIITKSNKLIERRILDLFIENQTVVRPEFKRDFTQRLMWFLTEFQEHIRQQEHATILEESVEYRANLDDDNAPDLVDEYFKTQRDVFTLESWDQFNDEFILPMLRQHLIDKQQQNETPTTSDATTKKNPQTALV
jgi:hypothetical protein